MLKIPSIVITLAEGGLSIAGLGDVGTELGDVNKAINAPTEADLDQCVIDLGPILQAQAGLSAPQSGAVVAIGLTLVPIFTDATNRSAEIVTFLSTSIAEMPNVDPKWKPSAEHSAALAQALKDCASDYGV